MAQVCGLGPRVRGRLAMLRHLINCHIIIIIIMPIIIIITGLGNVRDNIKGLTSCLFIYVCWTQASYLGAVET